MQGSITVAMDGDYIVSVSASGDLSHVVKVGVLTMALHNLEFSAMTARTNDCRVQEAKYADE